MDDISAEIEVTQFSFKLVPNEYSKPICTLKIENK